MPDRTILTLDLDRITLGEMMDVELASGKPFTALLKSPTGRMLATLYLQALQKHVQGEPLPSWNDLQKMTPYDVLQFVSPAQADSD